MADDKQRAGRLGIRADRLTATLRHLTQEIGVRLAGTAGEKRAEHYIADQFRRAGAQVSRERFPMQARVVAAERLEVFLRGRWRAFPTSLFSSTPGTNGRIVEAPLLFFESPAEYDRADLSHLSGKAVVHLGCHFESRRAYQRLLQAGPACLLCVDTRYPGAMPLADGLFPAYTRALGAVPTMNVAYLDAWRWKVEGASAVRLRVSGGMKRGESANVIAEFPGRDPAAGIIFLGSHHDTQANSVGADDNGSGVAGLIELARVLSQKPRRRTLRLISFGTEEQLSLGSAEYVRRHRREIAGRGQFMFNLDSYGSWLGTTELVGCGPAKMAAVLRPYFERRGLYVRYTPAIVPYADHFPFVAAGIPGIWLGRKNCLAGRFFHHRPDDDLSRVAPGLIAELLDAVAAFILAAANAPRAPFARTVPKSQARQVRRYWTDLFGGWGNPRQTTFRL